MSFSKPGHALACDYAALVMRTCWRPLFLPPPPFLVGNTTNKVDVAGLGRIYTLRIAYSGPPWGQMKYLGRGGSHACMFPTPYMGR